MQTANQAAPATPQTPQLFTLQIPAIGADWPEHGGKFGGIVFSEDGTPKHLLIVGPESVKKTDHAGAITFAAELKHNDFSDWTIPNCVEGHILAANRAALDFKREWYWLSERHADYNDFAWCQSFDNGRQYYDLHDGSLRARAVRRLAI